MPVDIWLRNPHAFIRDALANGYTRFAYDRRWCATNKIDPVAWLRAKTVGVNPNAELLLYGPQGAAHYDVWSHTRQPKAVYPVWLANKQPIEDLVDLIEQPVSELDPKEFQELPEGLRPVPGQKHMVVIGDVPNMQHGVSKAIMREVAMVAASNPDVVLHIAGNNTFSTYFDYGAGSVDFDPVSQDQLHLANGITLTPTAKAEWAAYADWPAFLGFSFNQVAADRRVRIAHNIKAVHWAAKYWNNEYRYAMKFSPDDRLQQIPDSEFVPATNKQRMTRHKTTTAMRSLLLKQDDRTDFIVCNGCLYRMSCKLMRADSVCTYKGTDTVGLADAFGSRNADRIIDGLSNLLKMQANRVEVAADQEVEAGELDPEVTKQMNSLFKNGVMLAKLLNPELNGRGVNVNVGIVNAPNAGAVAAADPRQLVSNAVRALEAQGIPRDEITQDMIKAVLVQAVKPEKQAIEGKVVNGGS